MNLKILLPSRVFLETRVSKVVGEAKNGSFCLRPRHVDFVTALAPGLLSFHSEEGKEVFLAVDEGILVKCGAEILVSTRHAVQGPDLGQLKQTVREEYENLDERERLTRSATARLEANLVRRFVELQHYGT